MRGLRLDLLDGEGDGSVEDFAVEVHVQLQQHVSHLRLVCKHTHNQELLIRKKDGPSRKFMGTERESRERAQDANVVGAGNLNVRNQ